MYVTAIDRALGPQTEWMNFDAPVMLREKKNKKTLRALGHVIDCSAMRISAHAQKRDDIVCVYVCVCLCLQVDEAAVVVNDTRAATDDCA